MCSRGTLGYPFLVGEIDHFLKTGELLPPPSSIDRLACAKEHLQNLYLYKGERGILQARKHLTWYAKGFSGAVRATHPAPRNRERSARCGLLDRQIELLAQAV